MGKGERKIKFLPRIKSSRRGGAARLFSPLSRRPRGRVGSPSGRCSAGPVPPVPPRSLKAQVSLCPLPAWLPSPPQRRPACAKPPRKKILFFSELNIPKKLELSSVSVPRSLGWKSRFTPWKAAGFPPGGDGRGWHQEGDGERPPAAPGEREWGAQLSPAPLAQPWVGSGSLRGGEHPHRIAQPGTGQAWGPLLGRGGSPPCTSCQPLPPALGERQQPGRSRDAKGSAPRWPPPPAFAGTSAGARSAGTTSRRLGSPGGRRFCIRCT